MLFFISKPMYSGRDHRIRFDANISYMQGAVLIVHI